MTSQRPYAAHCPLVRAAGRNSGGMAFSQLPQVPVGPAWTLQANSPVTTQQGTAGSLSLYGQPLALLGVKASQRSALLPGYFQPAKNGLPGGCFPALGKVVARLFRLERSCRI